MKKRFVFKPVTVLSYILTGAIAISSAGGVFFPGTYAQETPSWAAQGIGQDVVNLLLVVPLLALSAFLSDKGGKISRFVLAGTLLYSVYSYVLYGFCVHFNRLFFAYCAALGLSVYALVLLAGDLQREQVETWFHHKKSMTIPATYFLFTTAIFYFLWLSEDIPALLAGVPPKSLEETGLFTNPVHVLDLSIVLPAMLIASLQLWRKKPFGYLFFPIMMVFAIVMGAAIGGMMVVMTLRGVSSNMTVVYVFGVVVLLDTIALAYFFRSLKEKH